MSHLLARRRKNSANLDVYTGPARAIRPRPIPHEERLPVVYLSHKPQQPEEEQSEEEQEVELDPALIEFLKAQEAEHERFRALCQDKTKADADAKIFVPTARPVADYEETNVPAMQASAPTTYSQLDPINTAYLRYQDMWVRQTVEQVLTSYDVTEEDEAWLAKHNTKACKAIAAQKPAGACTMDATLLETLLTKLELAHFEALQQRGDEWEPEVQAGRVPQLPDTQTVLPKPIAAAKLRTTNAPPYAISCAYDFWLGKRRRSYRRGPLLQHLWYEEPWKSICFEDPEEPGEQGDMPFCISETRNSTARAAGRHVSDQELWKAMAGVRAEMEALRTLADQVRKRERTKKQLLKAWREQFLPGSRRPNRKLTRLLSTLPLAKQQHPQTQKRKTTSANPATAPAPRVLKGSAVGANLGVQKKRVKGSSSRKGSAAVPESKEQQQEGKAVQRRQPKGSAVVSAGLKRAGPSKSSSNSRSKQVRTRLIRRQGVAGTGVGCARGSAPRKKGMRLGGRSAMVFQGKAGRGGHWVRREVVERVEREAAAAAAAAAAAGGATAEGQVAEVAEKQGQELQGADRGQHPALQHQQQRQQQQQEQHQVQPQTRKRAHSRAPDDAKGLRKCVRLQELNESAKGLPQSTQAALSPFAAASTSPAATAPAHAVGQGKSKPSSDNKASKSTARGSVVIGEGSQAAQGSAHNDVVRIQSKPSSDSKAGSRRRTRGATGTAAGSSQGVPMIASGRLLAGAAAASSARRVAAAAAADEEGADEDDEADDDVGDGGEGAACAHGDGANQIKANKTRQHRRQHLPFTGKRKLSGAAATAAAAAAAKRAQRAPQRAHHDASSAQQTEQQEQQEQQNAPAAADDVRHAQNGPAAGAVRTRRAHEAQAEAGQRQRQDASRASRPPAAHVLLPPSPPHTRHQQQQQQQQQQSPTSDSLRHSRTLLPPPLAPLKGSAVASGLPRSLRSHTHAHPSSLDTLHTQPLQGTQSSREKSHQPQRMKNAQPQGIKSGPEGRVGSLQGEGSHVQEDGPHRLQGGGPHLQGEQHHLVGERSARGHTPAPSIWTRIVQGLGLATSKSTLGGRAEGSGVASDRSRGATEPQGVGGSPDASSSPGARKKRKLGGAAAASAAAAADRRAQQQQQHQQQQQQRADGALIGQGAHKLRGVGEKAEEDEERGALPQSPVFWSKSKKRKLGGAAAASVADAAARRVHEQQQQQQQQQQRGEEEEAGGSSELEDDGFQEEAEGGTAGRLGREQRLQGRGRKGEQDRSTRGQAGSGREGVRGSQHLVAKADMNSVVKKAPAVGLAMGHQHPLRLTRQQQKQQQQEKQGQHHHLPEGHQQQQQQQQQQQRQPRRKAAVAATRALKNPQLWTPANVDCEEEEFVGGSSSRSDDNHSDDSDSGL